MLLRERIVFKTHLRFVGHLDIQNGKNYNVISLLSESTIDPPQLHFIPPSFIVSSCSEFTSPRLNLMR